MILTIDFFDKVVYIQSAQLKDLQNLPKIIEAAGYIPQEFEFRTLIHTTFENDNTGGVDIVYHNKEDIN